MPVFHWGGGGAGGDGGGDFAHIKHDGQVLERQKILNKVWGFDYYGTARTIDNFVTKLRQKIEASPDKPEHFQTVRGVGYKFVSGTESG